MKENSITKKIVINLSKSSCPNKFTPSQTERYVSAMLIEITTTPRAPSQTLQDSVRTLKAKVYDLTIIKNRTRKVATRKTFVVIKKA